MKKIVILPSELNTFAFCQAKAYYNYHYKKKPKLKARIRMMIGRFKHFLFHIKRRDYKKEQKFRIENDEFIIIGKIDAYKEENGELIVEEYKSGKRPACGIYESDKVQLLAYMYLLNKTFNKPVKGFVVYSNGRVEVSYDEQLFLRYVEKYIAVISGFQLAEKRRGKWCDSCQYQVDCFLQGEYTIPPELLGGC